MVSGPQLLLSAGSSSVVLAQAGCPCRLTRKDGWRSQRIPRDAGLCVRGANLGASASRGPAGLRRARMRYPGHSTGSLPRLCGEPCGRILVWRRPRSHATRGPLHGPARMRAGRAGSNVPSREVALRVTDRDIRAGYGPHIAPCKHSRRQDVTAATPQAMPPCRLSCLHAAERRLRHRAIDHWRLLRRGERRRNPVFEGGHLRCRVPKINCRSTSHAGAGMRKTVRSAKTRSAGKAVGRADHTGQRQRCCKERFHDRVPVLLFLPSPQHLVIRPEAA
jgi:hypothetical protein